MLRTSAFLLSLLASAALAAPASWFDAVRQLPATPWESSGGGPKSLWCPLVDKAPVLDGKLDDACWLAAGKARPFIKADGGMAVEIPADYKTLVLVCRDGENLYMAWTVTGDLAREIAASPKPKFRNDIGNYRDCYSVAFQMLGGDNQYTFYMNSKGNTGAFSLREESAYKGAFSAASAPTADGAIIEVAIPFANPGLRVPTEGEWWRIQLNRVSNYEWSAQNIQFCAFDYLYFGPEKDFRAQKLPIPPELNLYGERYVYNPGGLKTQFLASIRGGVPSGASMRLQLLQGDKAVAEQVISAVTQPYLAFLFDTRGLPPGDYRMTAALHDRSGSRLLQGAWPFTMSATQDPAATFPAEGIKINVHEQNHVPDGVWPVSVGVPLPRGAVQSAGALVLLEDRQPIAANIIPRATWFPATEWQANVPVVRDGNSIKWLGVSFNARYVGGKPRTYVLSTVRRLVARSDIKPGLVGRSATVDGTPSSILINTGVTQLQISKTTFAGIRAWLDRNGDGRFDGTEKSLLPGSGPYVVDQDGRRYAASGPLGPGEKLDVVIEEEGPARVVVAVKGWYRSDATLPLCMYNTRIIAFAGLPFFQINHRTLLTCDNRKLKLADAGFALRAPGAKTGLFGTMDGEIIPAIVDGSPQAAAAAKGKDWQSFLHQDRDDHFRLLHGWAETLSRSETAVSREGWRSDGSASVSGDGFRVSVFLRDAWEKYPKELEVGSDGINLHFWPRHGRDAFTAEEIIGKEHFHQARFAHTGRLLNLQIPDDYLARIKEAGKGTDAGQECLYGYGSPGQGVVISNDFYVLLEGGKPGAPVLNAGLARQAPGAYADPVYACATDVFEKIHPQDFQRFPQTERAIEKGFLALYRFIENSRAYGMFLYAGFNTGHTAGVNHPTNWARLWANSHYQEASAAWLLYFRSGNPDMLKWARAYSESFMNVGTCNYDDPAHPLIASNPDGTTKGFHVPMAGQQFHCKSPVPWGGPMASNGHFIDPQSIYMRYVLEGDYAARDVFGLWGAAVKRTPVDMTPHRDTNATIAHLIEHYTYSWDPYDLALIHQCAVPLLNTPFAKHGAGHFHKYWVPRYYDLTRDSRALDRVREWIADVGLGTLGWQVDAPAAALLYRQTGDRAFLPVIPKGPAAYDNPADPWDGYNEEAFTPYAGFYYSAIIGGMHAVAQAGLDENTAAPRRGLTPQLGVLFKDRSGQDADCEVLMLRRDNRAFELKMENCGCNEGNTSIRLLDADGKLVVPQAATKYDGRYVGPKVLRVSVPADGPTGLLQLAMRGGPNLFSWIMPASDLDGEAAVLRSGATYKLGGPFYSLAAQPGQEDRPVALDIATPTVAVLRLRDAAGADILNTSIAKGLLRDRVSLTADPKLRPWLWTLEIQGAATFRADGPDRLYLSPDPKGLKAVVEEVGKGR